MPKTDGILISNQFFYIRKIYPIGEKKEWFNTYAKEVELTRDKKTFTKLCENFDLTNIDWF